ncbi:MAG: hypothetical protein ACI9MR_004204, partial [Myxococcota bacterium]
MQIVARNRAVRRDFLASPATGYAGSFNQESRW